MQIICPRCGSPKTVKNGQANGNPKRKCKKCYYQYTKETLPGAHSSVRLICLLLYVHGLPLHAIAKLFHYSTPTILRWIKMFERQHFFDAKRLAKAKIFEVDDKLFNNIAPNIDPECGRLIIEIPQTTSTTKSLAAILSVPLRKEDKK